MQVAIPWLFVTFTFFTGTWVIFSGLLDVSSSQGRNLTQAHQRQVELLETHIAITSAETTILSEGSGMCASAYLVVDTGIANSGDVSFAEFGDADVILSYIDESGSKVETHPDYVSGSPADDQWTVSSIAGDNFDLSTWDPDEIATIQTRPSSLPKTGSQGTFLFATPQGFTDSAYVDFDYESLGTNDCRYLHNNPTPATGDTNRQADLSMNKTAPTATTLYNYDVDVDPNLGRTIQKGGVGPGESDLSKYQNWRTGVLAEPLILSGTVAVDIWAAIQGYELNKAGVVTVYFRDYDGSSYTEIGQGTMYDSDWHAGTSNFVRKAILIPGFDYTIPAGNQLEVKFIVGAIATSEMWFVYDTTTYQSLMNLSYIVPTYNTLYYMHNNPTPSTADTDAQSPLTMDTAAPTATTLYNYDQNYDSDPGRGLQKTPKGLAENGLQKHQVWRTGALGSNLALAGDIGLDLWGGMINFDQDKTGIVTVYLRDYDGGSHTEVAHATVYAENWQDGSSTWVKRPILFPELDYTVSSGNELEVFMVVENDAAGDMWFAYDTTAYPMVLKIP